MTALHFLNCAALAFGPLYIVYKATRISERGGIRSLFWGIVAYFLTQLVKLVVAAAILSSYTPQATVFEWSQEIATLVLGLIDVGGVWFALSRASGTNDIKLLSIGLGWAIANNTAAYGPELWINSRTLQFSWTHIQNSIDSNIMLVILLGFIYLVHAASNNKSRSQTLAHVLIGCVLVIDIVSRYLKLEVGVCPWIVLGVRGAFALGVGGATKAVYSE